MYQLINKYLIFYRALLLSCLLALLSFAHADQDPEPDDSGASGEALMVRVHKGEATFFKTNGKGACLLGKSSGDMMLAAVDEKNFADATLCGAYLNIKGPEGEVVVKVVDLCPGCETGHLDLSPEAFARVGDLGKGRVTVSWQVISPEMDEPVAYFFKTPNAKNVGLVQVRSHRHPVAKLEFQSENEEWVEIPRVANNYFEYYAGMGPGPFTFRVTDIHGNELVDTEIAYAEGKPVNGEQQFPVWDIGER